MTILSFGVGGGYGGHGYDTTATYVSATYGDLTKFLLAGSGGSGAGADFFDPHGGGGAGGGGAIEFGAATSLTVTGTALVEADGGNGGVDGLFGYTGGGGSGGGLIFDAPTVLVTGYARVNAESGFTGGGGGRILFLSDGGSLTNGGIPVTTVAGLGGFAQVGAALYGSPGTIDIGTLSSVPGAPEPSTWAMLGMGFLGVGFAARRRRPLVA